MVMTENKFSRFRSVNVLRSYKRNVYIFSLPDTTNAVDRANLVLQSFHRQEPELEMMCIRSRCSYEQVAGAITPSHLTVR